jgi:hypothetical protein
MDVSISDSEAVADFSLVQKPNVDSSSDPTVVGVAVVGAASSNSFLKPQASQEGGNDESKVCGMYVENACGIAHGMKAGYEGGGGDGATEGEKGEDGVCKNGRDGNGENGEEGGCKKVEEVGAESGEDGGSKNGDGGGKASHNETCTEFDGVRLLPNSDGVSNGGGNEACKEIISEGGCIGGGGTPLPSAVVEAGFVCGSSPGGPETAFVCGSSPGGPANGIGGYARPGGGIILP